MAPKDAQRAEIPQVADAQDPEPQNDTPETIIAALPARSIPLPDFAPRPKADVGAQTPENVPFGMADATASAAQTAATAQSPASVPFGMADATGKTAATPQAPVSVPFGMADPSTVADPAQVAVNNIPLPTWRPDVSLPADLAPQDKDVLLALADTGSHNQAAIDAFSVLPSARPDEVKAVLEQASSTDGYSAPDGYHVASLSEPRSAFNDPSGVDAASPRDAIAARPAGSDPASAIGAGVKTTRKESRATARDLKPGPKPMVVAAVPQAARWALHSGEQVSTVSDATTAPRLAYNFVRTAPSEVYTAGFQSDNQMADANRFTGNAVKFLSVARFQTK